MMKKKTKLELLYCMDFIMHHLSDDEAISPWLEGGIPDGLYQQSVPPPTDAYRCLQYNDSDFDYVVALFTTVLAR